MSSCPLQAERQALDDRLILLHSEFLERNPDISFPTLQELAVKECMSLIDPVDLLKKDLPESILDIFKDEVSVSIEACVISMVIHQRWHYQSYVPVDPEAVKRDLRIAKRYIEVLRIEDELCEKSIETIESVFSLYDE